MRLVLRHRLSPGLALGLALGGMGLYLYGLAATLQLGDIKRPGMLLIPALPLPLYVVMVVVACAGVGITLLAALRQRRRQLNPESQRQTDMRRTPWQTLVHTLGTLTLCGIGLVWLMRHSAEVQQFFNRLRFEVGMVQDLLDTNTRVFVQQVQSPATGYALLTVVLLVYGGMGLLGLWILCERWGKGSPGEAPEGDRPRQVQRAVAAGLQELRLHADPRQAIIACYARLEHLLEDRGLLAVEHLTPQEYMGEALRELVLPLDAFAELVHLFELARYSLHPLDDTARTRAMTCLERLREALAQEQSHAVHV